MHDLGLAVRTLRATPIVTSLAIASLALGIGASSAMFSLTNALLLRPLPVHEPHRLFSLVSDTPDAWRQFSYATLSQIRELRGVFDGVLGATSCCGASILTIDRARYLIDRQFVTGDFFTTLGVPAFRGRLFRLADDRPSAPDGPVAVISYRLWQQRFAAREDLVGSQVTLDGAVVTIVGVTPPEFLGVEVGTSVDILVPQYLAARLTSSPFDDDNPWLAVMVRVKPGLSAAAATARLREAQPDIRAASMPKGFPGRTFLETPFRLEPAAAQSRLRTRFERPLVVLFAIVILVLLIACANIANLLLARGVARRHELSIRVALGSSRWRLARQLLTESLLLSMSGAALGLLVAAWAPQALVAQLSSPRAPILLDTTGDWRVFVFTIATAVATALFFGTVPALRSTRVPPIEALRTHGRGAVGGRPSMASSSLIVIQMAVSLLLVVVAGLFVKTFDRLLRASLGFNPAHVLVASVAAPTIPAIDRGVFFDDLVKAVAQAPGVAAAGGALNPPLVGGLTGEFVVSAPGTPAPANAPRIPQFDSITPGWVAAYGIPLEAGRDFDARDTRAAPLVMLVNDAFVRRLFPGQPVLGKPLALWFRQGQSDVPLNIHTIVGVVADSVYRTVREPARPMIYVPLAQREALPQKDAVLAFRAAAGSPELLERSVATAIERVSGEVAFTFQPLAQHVDEAFGTDRLLAVLSGCCGGVALILAGLGLYGVTAHTVGRRRTEIGIRMALGATPTDIARNVMVPVAALVAAGTAIGAIGSMWASRLVRSLLFGLTPGDPATLVGAAAVLAVVGAIAAWIPAARASRINPSEVLGKG